MLWGLHFCCSQFTGFPKGVLATLSFSPHEKDQLPWEPWNFWIFVSLNFLYHAQLTYPPLSVPVYSISLIHSSSNEPDKVEAHSLKIYTSTGVWIASFRWTWILRMETSQAGVVFPHSKVP